jgi:hypothetical protein
MMIALTNLLVDFSQIETAKSDSFKRNTGGNGIK